MTRAQRWPLLLLIVPGVCGWLGNAGHGFIYKSGVAASGILLLMVFCRDRLLPRRDVLCVIAAFALSIAGDWFLSHRNGATQRFILGIAFFLLAHIGYLFFSLANGRFHRLTTVMLLIGFTLFFAIWINPAISEAPLKLAVFLYVIVSCLSLGAAAGLRIAPAAKWACVTGISLVLFSDWIIAMNEFTRFKILSGWILPTYYLAQISVTLALLLREGACDAPIRTSA